ncbi:MAG: YeeE/YedE family protein [Pseudomonadota bacterium]
MSSVLAVPAPLRSGPQWRVLAVAAAGTLLLAIGAYDASGWRKAALALVGCGLGIALYHAAFGFTSAWRTFLADRKGAGLRAQMVLLAITCTLAFPLIGAGELFGQRIGGFVMPIGVSLAVGAFLFGIGMQLGGACASGTLYTAGGGSTRMVVTLIAFIAGSVIATAHLPWWLAQGNLGAFSMVRNWGLVPALALHLLLFAAIFWGSLALERRRHGTVEAIGGAGNWLAGPWPKLWGAVAIAGLAVVTLMLAGRPWGITSAFALWGAKAAHLTGYPITDWSYWQGSAARLENSLFIDTTSVMNFGIMIGALAAAGLAGKYAPQRRVAFRPLIAAVLGGLAMGYGARLAFGCNIGAYFSGIVSSSLHGWAWALFAIPGSIIGIRLRPFFRL